MTYAIVGAIAWWLIGLGVVFEIMWQNRPNGAWWILLPAFALIWPFCWLTVPR